MTSKTLLLSMTLLLAAGGLTAAPYRAKLLHYGWDHTNAFELAERYRQMEETMPFDGVMFPLTNEGISTFYIWDANPWPDNVFDNALASLKTCEFRRFTDNFVMTWISPGPVDWLDDNAWRVIASKFGIVARVARQAGLKGICFDSEPYANFRWNYREDCGRSFEDVKVIARSRGRAIMTAIAAEYPDMTFMAFWLISFGRCRAGQKDWGLYATFIDGLWDAVPPEMTVIDASESGYALVNQTGALRTSLNIRHDYANFVSPENRAKYRRQCNAGFGIYLDPYVYPGWINRDGTQLVTLFHYLNNLLYSADQYVWFYSEKHRMFSLNNPNNTWEAKLPGLDKTLRMAMHPEDFLEELERKGAEGAVPNRWPNPTFEMKEAGKDDTADTSFTQVAALPRG